MKTKAERVREYIAEAGSRISSVTFVKRDGSIRTLSFNARTQMGVKGEEASEIAKKALVTFKENNPNIIRVMDQQFYNKTGNAAASWRSFDVENVISIKADGVNHTFDD